MGMTKSGEPLQVTRFFLAKESQCVRKNQDGQESLLLAWKMEEATEQEIQAASWS